MGGVDSANATTRVVDAIAAAGLDVYVDVVLGARAPHLREVTVRQNDRVAVHVDHPDLAALAAEADLAVGAGGTASFERAVLGLPSIIVGVADNQIGLSAAFAEAGAAEVVPSDIVTNATAFGERIKALAGDGERRKSMSKRAAAMTDGRGALRLLAAVAGTCEARDGKTVRLRLAESRDVDWLLDLQRQEATRRFARNPRIPDAAEHATWFASMLADSARLLTVITIDDEACGMLRLDRLTGTDPAFEISIAVDGQRHRSGVGRAALKLARQLAPGADLLATVKPENAASLALFAGAGYAHEAGDLYRCRAA
jgi:RimJ/RimL family protein N-acetyltransferase